MNTWSCICGAKGTENGLGQMTRALTEHLVNTGHPSGEYSYGSAEKRTTVHVELDADRNPVQRLVES